MIDRLDNALIVFVKNPVPGKVKTRLALTIGNERAFDIYIQLLGHTLAVASMADADLVICYSEFIPDDDAWSTLNAHRSTQKGDDMGECMHNALSDTLKTYKRAVLIGSDCGELTTDILDKAFEALSNVDTVIGPAVDGGYYLVGTTQPVSGIFNNVDWSTQYVLRQTISRLLESGLNFGLGITLRDVDDEDDWEALEASETWILDAGTADT